MKKTTLITLLYLIFANANAQSNVETLFPIFKGGKLGYINAQGKMVVQPKYQVEDPQLLPNITTPYLLIKEKGNAKIYYRSLKLLTNEEYSDARFDDVNKLIRVNYFSKATKDQVVEWIDYSGKKITKKGYNQFSCGYQFKNGLCKFIENSKWGFFDTKGNIIIPAKYAEVTDFNNGYAWVKLEDGGEAGLINTKGDVIIEPKYDDISKLSQITADGYFFEKVYGESIIVSANIK